MTDGKAGVCPAGPEVKAKAGTRPGSARAEELTARLKDEVTARTADVTTAGEAPAPQGFWLPSGPGARTSLLRNPNSEMRIRQA